MGDRQHQSTRYALHNGEVPQPATIAMQRLSFLIRTMRERGLSRPRIGKLLHTSPSNVEKIEKLHSAAVGVNLIEAAIEAFDLDPGYFFADGSATDLDPAKYPRRPIEAHRLADATPTAAEPAGPEIAEAVRLGVEAAIAAMTERVGAQIRDEIRAELERRSPADTGSQPNHSAVTRRPAKK